MIWNFEWFINTYEKVTSLKTNDLSEETKESINKLTLQYSDNYKQFIDKVFDLLNLDNCHKQAFYDAEKFCIKCKTNYPNDYDPFVIIYNENKVDLTYSLCKLCTDSLSYCSKCDYFIDGPWNIFILDQNTGIITCKYCYNSLEVPKCNKKSNKSNKMKI